MLGADGTVIGAQAGWYAPKGLQRAYLPSLSETIYGGTSEIMKTIIASEVTGLRT